jgi:hypothetical protein
MQGGTVSNQTLWCTAVNSVAQFSRAQVEDGARLALNYAGGFTVAVDYGGDVSPPSVLIYTVLSCCVLAPC